MNSQLGVRGQCFSQATLALPAGKEDWIGGGNANHETQIEHTVQASTPLPAPVLNNLARTLLPQMQAFFSSEIGQQQLKQWQQERRQPS